ncbi:MAG: flagellar basal body rod protein FlgC [Clostridiaceae bacterium]|nr:flagellar basal body rod protein FlgC [Eubacteriales bacterium]
MSFLNAFNISGSALTAQRMRMDVIAQNLANASTTRTEDGGPYRRQVTVLSENKASFSSYLNSALGTTGGGVKVSGIVEDDSDFKLEYDPTNPDADADGYVHYPNVNEVTELIDMMAATRAYEANVTALNSMKSMMLKALEIGK